MVERVANEITFYITELGNEGRLIQMQLDELASNVLHESKYLVYDYAGPESNSGEVYHSLDQLGSEDVLDLLKLAGVMGYDGGINVLDLSLHPKGYRVLRKIPKLPMSCIEKIVNKFSNLQAVLNADADALSKVENIGKARAKMIEGSLRRFKESSLMERYV
jgi:diadenylate cyclase